MAEKPLTSIIIATHAYNKELKSCLKSIVKNTGISYQVIVISEKKASKNYFSHPKIEFLKIDSPAGPAEKRNIGCQKAKGEYFVFLDSDTIVDKYWLKPVIDYLDNHPKIGAGQLKLLKMGKKDHFDSAGEKLTCLGFLSERARSAKDTSQFDKIEPIFSGKMAAMVIRKQTFVKAGRFDNDYFYYWEEPDLCWRIWKSGYQVVFLPMGKVWHAYDLKLDQTTKEKLTLITYLGCRNHLLTILKNGVGFRLIIFFCAVLLSWIWLSIMFLFKGSYNRFKAVYRAFFWLISNPGRIYRKRKNVQQKLGKSFYSDHKWMALVKANRGIKWYFGKGISYILNKPF